MTALRVKQIESKLKDLFAQHLDISDIKDSDAEKENKTLTRALAALAVFMEAGCSEQDAAESVWDGQDDNGIDAVYFDRSEQRLLIVQSKWIKSGTGEPEAKDLNVVAAGVKDLVEDEIDNFAIRLRQKIQDVSQHINTPGVSLHILLISTGASELSQHATRNLDRVLNELNGNGGDDPIAHKLTVGISEVYRFLASAGQGDKIDLDANILEWSFVSSPYPAYFGMMDGLQLKDWWSAHGKRLVAKNIRHALGSTEVNEKIRSTVTDQPEHFWYFNNGITLIAEEASKAPRAASSRSSGIFQFRSASIVNGAQTVSTLGRITDDVSLGKVRVAMRVVLLKDAPASFGSDVTKNNNLQNQVQPRDFAAQDPEQSRVQQEMGIEGIEYQYLRSGDFIPNAKSCDIIEVATAVACSRSDSNLAVQIKTGIGRIFSDITRAPYKIIFNPQLSGARAFNSVLVQRKIDAWIDAKKRTIPKKSGYAWTMLVHGNRILEAAVFKKIGQPVLSIPISDFEAKINLLDVNKACEEVYNKMLLKLESDFPNKFLAVLFKNSSMSKAVYDEAVK